MTARREPNLFSVARVNGGDVDVPERRPSAVDLFRAFVRSLTYKPGSTFDTRNDRDGVHFFVTLVVVDVDKPKATQILSGHDAWAEWVRSIVARLEDHEISEWLRSSGVPLVDPHPNGDRF